VIVVGLVVGFAIKSEISVVSSFRINVPRAIVFKVLGDFEAIPQWNSSVRKSTLVSNHRGLGCQFVEKRKGILTENDMMFTVMGYVPGTFIKAEGKSPKSKIIFEYRIVRTGTQNLVKLNFIEKPIPIILAWILLPVYQKNIDANMLKLKALIEEQ
jgi:hypothetical protein